MEKNTNGTKSEQKKKRSQKWNQGTGIAMGVALGAALGVVFDNIAIGMGLGIALGAALDARRAPKTCETCINKKAAYVMVGIAVVVALAVLALTFLS